MGRYRFAIAVAAFMCASGATRSSHAHHEALFGPQSSLAVESRGFLSLQMHEHVTGSGPTLDQESTYILSGGVTPFRKVPWSLALVQPFTAETARSPTGERVGPFSSCEGCGAVENTLVSTSYRFDFTGLQRATGKDGNFALLSASFEAPTGNKDYAPFHGPVNYIFAGMTGVEWRQHSIVGLGLIVQRSLERELQRENNPLL